MPTLSTTNATFNNLPAHRVYTREAWGGPWVLQPYLFCLECSHVMNPAISRARLVYRYGRGQQHDLKAAATYTRKNIAGYYCKIEIDQTAPAEALTWIGLIEEETDNRLGAATIGGARVLSGEQTIDAVGLEALLDRQPIRSSIVKDRASGNEKRVLRSLEFNAPNTQSDVGNRSIGRGSKGAFIFSEDPNQSRYWSTQDTVEYFVAHHPPADHNGDSVIVWGIDEITHGGSPTWDRVHRQADGERIKQALDALLDRRRAMGYYVTVLDDIAFIRTVPFNESFLLMPGGGIQNANQTQFTSDFDLVRDVIDSPVRYSLAHFCNVVRVVGDRVVTCFTVSFADGTLQPDWTIAQHDAYLEAASQNSNYPVAADVSERQRINALARSRDIVKRVYASFKVLDDWNFQAGDGIGGGQFPLLPDDVNQFEADGPERFCRSTMRFLPHLPIKDTASTAIHTEYVRPICLFLIDEPNTRYEHAERLADLAKLEGSGAGAGLTFACHCRMAEQEAGVVLDVSSGPQHSIAETDFVPLPFAGEELPTLDYQNNLICTVAAQADRYVSAQYPPIAPPVDVLKVVEIDLGRRFQLHYIVEGTVREVDSDGQLVHQVSGEYLRDDRSVMEDIARLAYQWYNTPRAAFRLSIAGLTGTFRLGYLITTIGSGSTLVAINSVITGVTLDLHNARTLVELDFAVLDFAQLFDSSPLARKP